MKRVHIKELCAINTNIKWKEEKEEKRRRRRRPSYVFISKYKSGCLMFGKRASREPENKLENNHNFHV